VSVKLIKPANRRDSVELHKYDEKSLSKRSYEEFAYVLDHLPHGRQSSRFITGPTVQVVGETYFTLLDVELKIGATVSIQERVYIGKNRREKINRIIGRINYDDLTESAKVELISVIEILIINNEEKFIDFFNRTQPVTHRMHSLELLPGVGKKLMWQILDERERKPFYNYKDLQERTALADPIKIIAKRIVEELIGDSKYKLFVKMG
jgi:putative nucleotide binding protein